MTKKKEELSGFKIGDTQKPGVLQPMRRSVTNAGVSKNASVGFPHLERMLEDEKPAVVAARLDALHARLGEFETSTSGARDKGAAKKAMVAVERTADLMDYLYGVKGEIAAGSGQKT